MLNYKVEIFVDQKEGKVISSVRPICPEHPQDQLTFSPAEVRALHGISVAAIKAAMDLERSLFHSHRTHETDPDMRAPLSREDYLKEPLHVSTSLNNWENSIENKILAEVGGESVRREFDGVNPQPPGGEKIAGGRGKERIPNGG